MKVSDYIVSYFEAQGINVIFGYIGGMITHLVDSISSNSNLKFVQTYHEQTAAIAAEGYAKESGKFGVAISTSGPGATNMITGIADAYFDSVPVVFITGQVNTNEYKYDKPVRQQGFQETDVVSIVKPITKYAILVDKMEDIRYELEKSAYIATNGRKGPVLLDIPINIQQAEFIPESQKPYLPEREFRLNCDDFDTIAALIEKSRRPMLLLGAGCVGNNSHDIISKFIYKHEIPVVTSLMGKSVVDEQYPYYVGMIGSYGNRCANICIANADLLIVLGSRLDTRQTGAKLDTFFRNGVIIHVDIDNNELQNNRLKNRIKINCDILTFLSKFDNRVTFDINKSWHEYILRIKNAYNQDKEIERFVENKTPYKFFHTLNLYLQENDIITVDVGQNQMWAAQTLIIKAGQKFITSGGLAPMGFAIPAAIGVSFANPDKNIFAICGDGGFHISVQALMLISQYNLPIKVIVMNNNALGMITQFQSLYFNNRMSATVYDEGYMVPNIRNIAEAYSLQYYKITEKDLSNKTLVGEIFSLRNCLIEYQIDGMTVVSPKLEYDNPIDMPSPLLPTPEQNSVKLEILANV